MKPSLTVAFLMKFLGLNERRGVIQFLQGMNHTSDVAVLSHCEILTLGYSFLVRLASAATLPKERQDNQILKMPLAGFYD